MANTNGMRHPVTLLVAAMGMSVGTVVDAQTRGKAEELQKQGKVRIGDHEAEVKAAAAKQGGDAQYVQSDEELEAERLRQEQLDAATQVNAQQIAADQAAEAEAEAKAKADAEAAEAEAKAKADADAAAAAAPASGKKGKQTA